ncbi:MAG: hypothetical protein J3R72DRAFT_443848 [Linnemannia gamsii]|nr:MAG: hypothetical protein J3R72DRAFT_443848 [Linnemannia gamsii]
MFSFLCFLICHFLCALLYAPLLCSCMRNKKMKKMSHLSVNAQWYSRRVSFRGALAIDRIGNHVTTRIVSRVCGYFVSFTKEGTKVLCPSQPLAFEVIVYLRYEELFRFVIAGTSDGMNWDGWWR